MTRSPRASALALLLVWVALPPAASVAAQQHARLSWDPPKGRTGEPVTLRILLPLHEGEGQVVFPEHWDPGDAEPIDRSGEVHGRGASMRWRGAIRLLPLAPGQLQPEPLRLTVVSRDGGLRHVSLEVPPLQVEERSAEQAQPLGPSPPVEVERFDPRPLLALLGLLLTAAGAWWVWRKLTSRRAAPPRPVAATAPRLPPWSEALRHIARLRDELEAELEAGRGDAWVDRLSDVLRAYLGAHYAVPALEWTSEELRDALAARMPPEAHQQLTELLRWADRVKFAGAEPSLEGARDALRRAERIVRASAPRPHAEPGGPR